MILVATACCSLQLYSKPNIVCVVICVHTMQMKQHFAINGQFAAAHSVITAELVAKATSTSSAKLHTLPSAIHSDHGIASSELFSVQVVSSSNDNATRPPAVHASQPLDETERILALQVRKLLLNCNSSLDVSSGDRLDVSRLQQDAEQLVGAV